MKNNQTFDKFKSKLTFEAVLNSLLLSLSIGFTVGGLIALICWLCGYKDGVWIALGVGAVAVLIAFPLFYCLKFRPSVKNTGRRVDTLGLQERAVTMLDYMDDDSYMANRQRDDATGHIQKTNATELKISVPNWLLGMFSGVAVFGIIFTVVCGLFMGEIIQSPTSPVDPLEKFVAVSYFVEDGGEIYGEADQLLLPGEDATAVTAIAMDGYMFVGWDDGNKNPSRTDLKITEDFEVTAQFIPIDGDPEDGDLDIDGPGNDGDGANDLPAEDGKGDNNQGENGDGQGSPGNSEGSGSGDQEGEGKGDGQGEGAGGKWNEGNQIVNGEIYYRDWLDQYYQDAMQEITSLDDLPPEIREFIESYYESV